MKKIRERDGELSKWTVRRLMARLRALNPFGGYGTLPREEARETILRYEYGPKAVDQYFQKLEGADDDPPGVGVTVGYEINCGVCGQFHKPPVCTTPFD